MWRSTSSISTWARKRFKRVNFIFLALQHFWSLPNTRKSTLQNSETSWPWARTNSRSKTYLKWKKIFSLLWTLDWQPLAATDSCRDIEEFHQLSTTMKFSFTLNTFKKFRCLMLLFWGSSHLRSQLPQWYSLPNNWRRSIAGIRTWRNLPVIMRMISRKLSKRLNPSHSRSTQSSSLPWSTNSLRLSIVTLPSTTLNSEQLKRTNVEIWY